MSKSAIAKDMFLSNSQHKQYMEFLKDLPKICNLEEKIFVQADDSNTRKLVTLALGNTPEDIQSQVSRLEGSLGVEYEYDTYGINKKDNPDRHILLDIYACINSLNSFDQPVERDKPKSYTFNEIIRIPLYTNEGMLINGQQYKFATAVEAEKGFQIKKSTTKNNRNEQHKELTVAFRPERGKEILIEYAAGSNGYVIKINNKKAFTLLEMLKAFSEEEDYNEILQAVSSGELGGEDWLFGNLTNSGRNKNVKECKQAILGSLLPYYNSKNDFVDRDFKTRILEGNIFKLSASAKENATRIFSFSNRCFNAILADSLEYHEIVEGQKITCRLNPNTRLTAEILDKVDADDGVTEIYIFQDNRKTRIVKHSINDNYYVDYDFLVNVCNLIAVEAYSDTDLSTIDSIQNKRYSSSYIFLKEFIMNSLNRILDTIKTQGTSVDGEFFLDLPNSIGPLRKACNFSEYYKELRTNSNVPCIQPLIGRNTISDSSGDYKTTSGLKNPTRDARAVRIENIFFLDSQASPESDKAGITQHLSATAFVDHDGHLANYFYKVKNGEVQTDEVQVLTVQEAYNKAIAPNHWNTPDEMVDVVIQGTISRVEAKKVEYVPVIPMSVSSPTIGIGVGVNANKGRRAQMAGNHAEQYTPILGGERHRVTTGLSSFWDSKIIRADMIFNNLDVVNSIKVDRSKGLKLVDIKVKDESMICTFAAVDPNATVTTDITVAYLKTISQMVIGYELNTNTRNDEPIYYEGEIVLHPMDVDTTQPDNIFLPEDITGNKVFDGFGYLDREDIKRTIREKDLAMGLNLRVAFMSLQGYSFEDGILIRRGLIESLKLSNIYTHVVDFEIPKNMQFLGDADVNKRLNLVGGKPKQHEYYPDGSVILAFQSTDTDSTHSKKVRVKPGQGGYVQSIRIHNKSNDSSTQVVSVTLGNIKHLEVGDKLTGHHGNKGVITRVLDDSVMPCDAQGNPVDVCVNPLGVPSRMNIGQLIEVALGLDNKNDVIIVPTNQDYENLIKCLQEPNDKGEFYKHSNLTTLYNNETLRPYPNKINVGTMYMMKLDHSVSKKMNFINESEHCDMKTGQPRKSEFTMGGQSVSEYASNAILANGAYKTHAFLFGSGSDDKVSRDLLKQILSGSKSKQTLIANSQGANLNSVGNNTTNKILIAYLRVVGFDLVGSTDSGFAIRVLTNEDIKNISSDNTKSYTAQADSILEPPAADFDGNKKSSNLYYSINCAGLEWVNPAMLNAELCKLFPVLYENRTAKNGNNSGFKLMTRVMVKDILNGDAYLTIIAESYEDQAFYYAKVIKSDIRPLEKEVYYTGGYALLLMFKNITKRDIATLVKYISGQMSDVEEDDESDDEYIDTNDDVDDETQKSSIKVDKLCALESEWKNFSEPQAYILNQFLLIPQKYRPTVKEFNASDSLNTIYKRIWQVLCIANNNVNKTSQNSSYIEQYNAFYKLLYNCLTSSDISTLFNTRNLQSPWSAIKDKDMGVIRSNILKKTVNFSGRSTIVGAPDLRLDQVYLPREAIYKMYEFSILGWLRASKELGSFVERLSKTKYMYNIIECCAHRAPSRFYNLLSSDAISFCDKENPQDFEKEPFEEINSGLVLLPKNLSARKCKELMLVYSNIEVLFELIDEVVSENLINERVILTREPALHRQNAQAFIPLMWENKTIGINTLVCPSYNADFDGDQMAVYAILPEECKLECDVTLTPDNLLTEDRAGGNNYPLKQDCVLGFYSATLAEPTENIVMEFDNVHELRKAVQAMQVNLSDTVRVLEPEKVSTAGRLYIESSLPANNQLERDLDSYYPLTSKTIDKLVMSYLPNTNKEFEESYFDITDEDWDSIKYIDFLDQMKRTAFLMQDLNNTTISVEDFIELNNIEHGSLNTAERRVVKFKEKCGFFHNSIEVQRVMDDKKNQSAIKKIKDKMKQNENSNLFRIFASGARGSFNNLSEPLLYGGYLKDLNDELLPVSIRNSLLDGLNSLELFLSGFEVRRAQLSTTLATKDAGVMTRTLTFMTNDEFVTKEDCEAEPTLYDMYFKPTEETEEGYFKNCHHMLLAGCDLVPDNDKQEQEEALKQLSSRPLDKGCYAFLTQHKFSKIYYLDANKQPQVFNFKYTVDNETYKRFTNRYGYRYGDNSKQVILTREMIDEYLEAGETSIYVRTLYDCKCSSGICSACYGADIHQDRNIVHYSNLEPAKLLPVNTAVGIMSAEVIGEILSQMAMDVKNASAEQDTTTNVVKRVKQIINLSDSQKKNTVTFGSSLYLKPGETAIYKGKGRVIVKTPTSKKSKFYFAPDNSILFGGQLTAEKPIRIIDGENNYDTILTLLSYEELQELIYFDIVTIINNLGENIDSRYIEILVHAMSRNSVILEDVGGFTVGQVIDTNRIKQFEELKNMEIPHSKIITNYAESNAGRGIIKSLCGQNPQKAISINIKRGIIDEGNSLYSRITLGMQIAKEYSDYQIGEPYTRSDNQYNGDLVRTISDFIEQPEQNDSEDFTIFDTSLDDRESGTTRFFDNYKSKKQDDATTETVTNANGDDEEIDIDITNFFG